MNDEQKEVLQLVKDGVINVDEAERLLNALREGAKKRSESSDPAGNGLSSVFTSIRENLSGIGPMIRDSLAEIGPAISNAFQDQEFAFNPDEFTEIDSTAEFELQPGSKLLVISDRHDTEEVRIEAYAGSKCCISSSDARPRIFQKGNANVVKCRDGSVSLKVPENISQLGIKIVLGNITVKSSPFEANLKTMNGNIEVSSISGKLTAKTMNGNIRLNLTDNWNSELSGVTMNGDVSCMLSDKTSADLNLSTMAGKIEVDHFAKVNISSADFPFRKLNGIIGENPTAKIRLKTMSGNVCLKKTAESAGKTSDGAAV
ncbi:MAG: DUF4097 family beta strand repeat-containing protein [Candidatus Wallbacteria bacterium]|nr:DUF4097 family beta strand repeat-containing protein [Candidatus Wallbacteria bacterium]